LLETPDRAQADHEEDGETIGGATRGQGSGAHGQGRGDEAEARLDDAARTIPNAPVLSADVPTAYACFLQVASYLLI